MRLFVGFLILAICRVQAATCTATTQAQVHTCLNTTMVNGDTLSITANFTFSGSEQPPPSLSNFTITGVAAAPPNRGAGAATTVLTNDGANPMFIIAQTAGGVITIKNMKMIYSGGFPGAVDMQCCSIAIRLTNLTLAPTAAGDRAFRWGQDWIVNSPGNGPLVRNLSPVNGLMDHITFTAAGTINMNNCVDGVGLYQGTDLDWTNPDNYGSTAAWYVEDSVLDGSGCSAGVPVSAIIDGEHGARLVFRHSDVKDMQVEVHDASTLLSLGTRLLETDSLNFTCSRADCGFLAIQYRGGSGFHHNNVIPLGTNGYENGFVTEITRVDSTGFQDPWFTSSPGGTCTGNGAGGFVCAQPKTCSDLAPHCDGVGGTNGSGQICGEQGETPGHPGLAGTACTAATCGGGTCGVCQSNPTGAVGTQSFCGSNPLTAGPNIVLDHIDGTDTTGGYPAINQVGRGQYIPGNNPRNLLRPIYAWNNKDGGGAQITTYVLGASGNEQQFIVQNREIFTGIDNTNCAPGAASCIGGVGQGTNANRPVNCSNTAAPAQNTYPGPAYFATDLGPQGTLWVCTAVNTWTQWYQPLQYPHPLQNSPVVTGTQITGASKIGGSSTAQ